jgi:hypothetical protein
MEHNNKLILSKALGLSVNDIKPGMHYDGNADLSGSPMTELPDRFSLSGYLDIANCPIEVLPDDMTIGGFLNMHNSKVKVFPKRLKTDGYINIFGTGLTEISDDMFCGGDFDFGNRFIGPLPEGAIVEGKIHEPFNDDSELECKEEPA